MQIPGYKILKPLGTGGMATVYLAIQEALDRKVAIKVMRTAGDDDPERSKKRFLREGRTLAKVVHKNVCAIYDIATVGNDGYIVMEYLDGGSLVDHLKTGISVGEAMAVVVQVASALQESHQLGIIHRDLKPANVMMRGGKVPVLTDFGIAREVQTNQTKITAENMIVGTPIYMSPEQVTGGEVDGRSDLYSLGIMFFELLTGKPPYQGDSPFAVGMQHLTSPLPTLPEEFTDIEPVIHRMLAKNRDDRYASMIEFIADLRSTFVRSSLLKKVLRIDPDSPWSDQLRELGFSLDTVRDASLKQAIDQRQVSAAQSAIRPTNKSTAVQPAQKLPKSAKPAADQGSAAPDPQKNRIGLWLTLAAAALLLIGGGGWWWGRGHRSATTQSTSQILASTMKRQVEARQMFAPPQDNAAQTLKTLRESDPSGTLTDSSERLFLQSLNLDVDEKLEAGNPDEADAMLLKAADVFELDRLDPIRQKISSARGLLAKKNQAAAMIADVERMAAAASLDLPDIEQKVANLRIILAGDPRLATLLDSVRGQLTGKLAIASSNENTEQQERILETLSKLFPKTNDLELDYAKQLQNHRFAIQSGQLQKLLAGGMNTTRMDLDQAIVILQKMAVLDSANPGLATSRNQLAQILRADVQRNLSIMNFSAARSLVAAYAATGDNSLADLLPAIEQGEKAEIARQANAAQLASIGHLQVDAIPWARVVALTDASGKPVALSGETTTPVMLDLPEGQYTITLEPGSGGASVAVRAKVSRGQTNTVKQAFSTMSAEQYLREVGLQ
jgi:serine/threonine-protein kinase PpkA